MANNPSPAELQLKHALQQSARTHLGKMFAPILPPEKRIPAIPAIPLNGKDAK